RGIIPATFYCLCLHRWVDVEWRGKTERDRIDGVFAREMAMGPKHEDYTNQTSENLLRETRKCWKLSESKKACHKVLLRKFLIAKKELVSIKAMNQTIKNRIKAATQIKQTTASQ
ncbi:16614_t:CDS:2, partial [Acaulospora colombiana]